jgi:hypothetical protein
MKRARVRRRPAAELGRKFAFLPVMEWMERRVLLTYWSVYNTNATGPGSLYAAISNADTNTLGLNVIDFSLPAEISSMYNFDPMYQQWTIDQTTPLPAINPGVQVTIDGYSQNVITSVPAADEVQTITLTGTPVSGTFTLSLDGNSTATYDPENPLSWDATATQIGDALMTLPNIGSGNVIASGGPINLDPVTITFTNHLATTPIDLIAGDATNIVSSGSPSEIETAEVTQGFSGEITSTVNTLTTGFNAETRIILEGNTGGEPAAYPGLTIESSDNIIRGLSIDGFSTGVAIEGAGATGNLIEGDYIGQYVEFLNPIITEESPSTVSGIGNTYGVTITTASNNVIGGVSPDAHDAISGNSQQGVVIGTEMQTDADGNEVVGDLIGVLEQDTTYYYQVGNGEEGVLVYSSSNLIGGSVSGSTNVISANQSFGIHIEGDTAVRNIVEGNYIGTDINGTYLFGQRDPGNGQMLPTTGNLLDGIFIDNAPNNQIGAPGGTAGSGNAAGNTIALNFGAGILISGGDATGNAIDGNVIGTGVDTGRPLGNAMQGILIESTGNSVGGSVTGAGNLISANSVGVELLGPFANNNLIAGNYIGTDGSGEFDLGNATDGIWIDSGAGNTIGGTVAAARNVISGNNVGVYITDIGAADNLVEGNYIGTDSTGSYDLGNSQQGIYLNGVVNNTIGGTASGAGNIISGNYWGIVISGSGATGNSLEGNSIGTDYTGAKPIPNETDGVYIDSGAADNPIGGTVAGAGNIIAFNISDGINIQYTGNFGNSVLSNSIFSNGGLGIDVVGNDYPISPPDLNDADITSSGIEVDGTITAVPGATYLLQFFSNPTALSAGSAQGQLLLASTTVTADNLIYDFSVPIGSSVSPGVFITATMTNLANNTSTFSSAIPVTLVPGDLSFSASSYVVNEADGSISITVLRNVPGSLVTVDYATTDGGTAIPGQRYTPVSGTLTFAPYITTESFIIPIIDEPGIQGNQTVILQLSNATGGATIVPPGTATLTIEDDPRLTNYTVTNTQNSGVGSLPWAVANADTGGPHTVNFILPAVDNSLVDYDPIYQQWIIGLSSTLDISGQVTIDGYSQNIYTTTTASNAVQTIAIGGQASGGTFTLSLDQNTTYAIPFNATAAQVVTALDNIDSNFLGNITATGGPVNQLPVTLTFDNNLTNLPVDPISGDGAGLVPADPSIAADTPVVNTSVVSQGFSGQITSGVNTLSPGFNASVRIILEGEVNNSQASFPAFTITSAQNVVRGLAIDGFNIGVDITGANATGNLIEGDYIGQFVSFLNPNITTGSASTVNGIGNDIGVEISDASNNIIGGVSPDAHDALSGNLAQGVEIQATANGNRVVGDLIGVLEQDSSVYYQVGNGDEGVWVLSSSNLIGGSVAGSTNIISANLSYGVHIQGPMAVQNIVEGNYIGTDINGTFLFGQGDPGNSQSDTGNHGAGIYIDGASDNQIGGAGGTAGVGNIAGNTIALNFGAGVLINNDGGTASGNAVIGNVIGTGINTSRPLGNAQAGVEVDSTGNSIGGTFAGAGNLISANNIGVYLSGTSSNDNLVAGNYIGTDGTGAFSLGNATEGILIDSGSGDTVGGSVAAARNVISGNNIGLEITDTGAVHNLVEGNYIGTDSTGSYDLGNSQQGVIISDVPDNTVGGTAAGAGNVISGNYWGVELNGGGAAGNVLEGNFIGTDSTGENSIPNEVYGVFIDSGPTNNLIGGTVTGAGNTIAFNNSDGIYVDYTGNSGNAILSNSIFSNGGLGIVIAGAGYPVSPPTLTTAGVAVSVSFSGDANATYLFQFFSNSPSAGAQGEQLLTSVYETTSADGSLSFDQEIGSSIPTGYSITATVTDVANNTSEFSAAVTVTRTVAFSASTYVVSESAGSVTITVLCEGAGASATVDYETEGGTSTPNQGYIPTQGTLSFGASVTTLTFAIPIIEEPGLSGPQTIGLTLFDPSGAILGTPDTATVTINPDPRLTNFSVTNSMGAGVGSLYWAISNAENTPGHHTVTFALPTWNPQALDPLAPYVDYSAMYQQWTIGVSQQLPLLNDPSAITIDGYTQAITSAQTAANESQELTFSSAVTGGQFTLTLNGSTTDPIAYDASATQIMNALETLPGLSGNVTVSGTTINGTGVIVTFTNELATTPVSLITGNPSGLIPLDSSSSIQILNNELSQGTPGSISPAVNSLTTGFNANVKIILEGSTESVGSNIPIQASFPALTIESAGNIIRGLAIDGFQTGIDIPSGFSANGNTIEGDYIGQYVSFLNPQIEGGTPSIVQGIGNGTGVLIAAGSNNVVGGVSPAAHNAISGNTTDGVSISTGSNGDQVTGNLIGLLQQDGSTYYLAGNGGDGVYVASSSNLIGGSVSGATNVISANGLSGIHIATAKAVRNIVESNDIGTDINGTYEYGEAQSISGQPSLATTGNLGNGIWIDNAPDNQIGAAGGAYGVENVAGNVIALNVDNGIWITGNSATGVTVIGNVIGAASDGSSGLGNLGAGVLVESPFDIIGGTVAGAGNLISANSVGVHIVGPGAAGALVAGNAIGTDSTGAYKLGNNSQGVLIDGSQDDTIGGTVAAARNIISGNNIGISITNNGATANLIEGNYVGTDSAGANDLGNSQQGILINSVGYNTLGGTVTGAGNLISGNYIGVDMTGLGATGNVLEGNLIGTDSTGKNAVPNETDGVDIGNSAANNLIGGTLPGAGNTIGFNVNDGVNIQSVGSVGNAILSNSIFSNGGLGIDLVVPSTGPGGPNNLIPAPTLLFVSSTASGVEISGTYDGSPSETYTIQLFSNPAGGPPGNVQGEQFLGTFTITTDSTGVANFTQQVPIFVPAGDPVTATATDATNDTSEFSEAQTEPYSTVQFAMTGFYASQADADAIITITRTPPPSAPFGGFTTVEFEISSGTAVYLTDYTAPAGTTPVIIPGSQQPTGFLGTVAFNPGQNTQTIMIPLLNDGLFNATKTINLTLLDPMGAARLAPPSTAILYIACANSPRYFSFSMANYTVNAAQGSITITVNATTGTPATVNYGTAGGTAVANYNYTPVSGTLVFSQGVNTQTFTIPIADQPGIKTNETIGLYLVDPTNSATLSFPFNATVTIEPDLVDRVGPIVESIRLLPQNRGSVKKLIVTFSKALQPSSAVNLLNYAYSVISSGPNHTFGTPDNQVIPIVAATYNAANFTVTLTLGQGIPRNMPFYFTINQSTSVPGTNVGVESLSGSLLDGNYSGVDATPFSIVLVGKKKGFKAAVATINVVAAAVPAGPTAGKRAAVIHPRKPGAHEAARRPPVDYRAVRRRD